MLFFQRRRQERKTLMRLLEVHAPSGCHLWPELFQAFLRWSAELHRLGGLSGGAQPNPVESMAAPAAARDDSQETCCITWHICYEARARAVIDSMSACLSQQLAVIQTKMIDSYSYVLVTCKKRAQKAKIRQRKKKQLSPGDIADEKPRWGDIRHSINLHLQPASPGAGDQKKESKKKNEASHSQLLPSANRYCVRPTRLIASAARSTDCITPLLSSRNA